MEPYFADQGVTLYLGDAVEVLPELGSFDLVVTDPPYGETSLDWDTYPTGWPQLVARHSKSMWSFGSMRMFLDHWADFAWWRLSQDVVWDKGRATSPAVDRFRRVHEHALHFYRGPWHDLYHQAPRVQQHQRGRRAPATTRHAGPTTHSGYGPSTWVETGTRLVESVLYAPKDRTGTINPTEKPVSVLELLIRYACPPGGTVLDVFAGSGSTAVAARHTGRSAVLIEMREEQCETTARRLSQGVLDLDGPP
ncbi:DNA-methyltransferase [Promicromonospora soli]